MARQFPLLNPGFEGVCFDPATLLIVAGAAQGLGTISQGRQAAENAKSEQAFLNAQANQEAVQRQRDQEDLQRRERATLARTRARIAAEGGDTTAGSGLLVQQVQSAGFGQSQFRADADSRLREQSLIVRGQNVRLAGRRQRSAALLQGVGQFGTSVFRSRQL